MGKNIFDFGYDFVELFKFFLRISPAVGQSPRGVSYPGESLMTPGSQLPILKLFAQAFKGTG